MSLLDLKPDALPTLHSKVLVLTGGSTGIASSLIRLLHTNGADIIFGDINTSSAAVLVNTFYDPNKPVKVHFLETDITKYEDVVNLFKKAYGIYGRVDGAVCLAGVGERGRWWGGGEDLETVEEKPDTTTLDVNLLGTAYFARVASVYLKQGQPSPPPITHQLSESESRLLQQPKSDKSLILISSFTSLLPPSSTTPENPIYQLSKLAIKNLSSSLKASIPSSHGIRVNTICPWITKTKAVSKIWKICEEAGVVVNTPEEVANVIAGVIVDEGGVDGGVIYCEGGRGWIVNEGLERCGLDEEVWGRLERGVEVLRGREWTRSDD